MENNRQLIEEKILLPACELLKNNNIQNHNFERPKFPTCVFYLGEKSLDYIKEMKQDLIRGWGEAANSIEHIYIKDCENIESAMYDYNQANISVQDLRSRITTMMSNGAIYSDMSHINIYLLLETTLLTDETFEKWYLVIQKLKEILRVSVLSNLMIILNDSLEFSDKSSAIRKRLYEIYKSNKYNKEDAHLYDAVYILSNRLKNGQYINLDPKSNEYAEYNLFGNIVLLTNTNDNEHQKRIAELYGSRVPAFLTAYRNISKPCKDICKIVLKRTMEIIRDSIETQNDSNISVEEIVSKTTGISNTAFPFADEFYKNYIVPKFPDNSAIKYLPYRGNCVGKKYDDINFETKNCLDLFVKNNYYDVIDKVIEDNKGVLLKKAKELIASKINSIYSKVLQSTTVDVKTVVSNVFSNYRNYSDNGNGEIISVINYRTKRKAIEKFEDIISNAFCDVVENITYSRVNFATLFKEIELMNTVSEEGLRQNLKTYYEDKVNMYFMDHNRKIEISQKILTECKSTEDVIHHIFELLRNIFNSDRVFSVPFVEELIKRVESVSGQVDIGTLVSQELIKGLDDRVSMYSFNVFRERSYEAYFINTSEENNELYNSLRAREKNQTIPITYFNTLSNEMIESIWVYRATEDNLRV